ncbi:MAG: NAD(P)-dependent alcohol dehydrogenase [Candidatus Lokiarchaeota archaeon]|nr:NAD(P)-dependent alcohol dehydrogenase [Candidatus Lokiarchaeota archaeon]
MKAIVYTEYGSPEVLQLQEVEKPTPKENEVLVKIHAASLNAADLDLMRGRYQPPFSRKPRYEILGSDIAGRIEAAGRSIKQFQIGDEILADLTKPGFGAFAEYVCVPEKELRLKPVSMTFEQAATIPQSAVVAIQGLKKKKKRQIQPGQKVLINGAGGGMGTFAVQIAKSFGAEVTGVDSTEKLDMLRSIGADHVIDYTQEDFTKSGQRYDRILDVAGHHSIFDYKRALNPKGIFGLVGGSKGTILQTIFLGPLISIFGSKKMGLVVWKPNNKDDMDSIKELFEAGKIVPVIDKRYPLSEVAEAMRYLEEGHVRGKLVITMEH